MDLRPLRRRDFRLLFAAQAISFLGTMVTYVALPWQMYALTRSSLAVGVLGVVELVPLLLTAFVGGALADWMDRRRLVIATEIGLMAGCLALMANAARTSPSIALLFVAAGVMSACNGLQRPSLDAMPPRLVPSEEIPAVAALSALRGSLGMIVGPAIGGVLVGTVGAVAAFGVDAASYFASLACFVAMRAVPPRDDAEAPSWRSIVEGFRYARSRQELIGTYVIDFVAMVFGMPLALFPALAAGRFGTAALGSLYAAPAVGALLASVTSRWTPRVHHHGLAVMIAATVWGVAIVAFGLAPSLWPALAFLAIAGAADAVSGMFRMTMWNQTIPDALRGRLAGIEMVSYMSGPLLGHAEAGAVAAVAGVQASIVSGGVLCVVGVIVCGLALPHFRRYDARRHAPPPC
ncbi:MAG: MFS transporter [Vicinamibacteraceae bacterium]